MLHGHHTPWLPPLFSINLLQVVFCLWSILHLCSRLCLFLVVNMKISFSGWGWHGSRFLPNGILIYTNVQNYSFVPSAMMRQQDVLVSFQLLSKSLNLSSILREDRLKFPRNSVVWLPARHFTFFFVQEPMKSRAPQLHLEYRFYKQLSDTGMYVLSHLYPSDRANCIPSSLLPTC